VLVKSTGNGLKIAYINIILKYIKNMAKSQKPNPETVM
jgi:hypothetical protein